MPTYNVTDEYQLRRNTVRASAHIPWVSCDDKVSSVYWNDDRRAVYVCRDYSLTNDFYDASLLQRVVVNEWFVFPVPRVHRMPGVDYWKELKKAVDATVLCYYMLASEVERAQPTRCCDHSLFLSKVQTMAERAAYRLTDDDVYCKRVGSTSVTAVDARACYNATMVCLTTAVSDVCLAEGFHRRRVVKAVKNGLLPFLDRLFHPTAVVSDVRSLLPR